MALTVGIHPDKFEIHFYDKRPGNARPFASLDACEGDGTVTLFLVSPAQCDDLIKAAVEAKRLLLGETSQPVHPFIRPGQVAPDLPAPDACVRCGQAEVAHLAAAQADPANPYGRWRSAMTRPGTARLPARLVCRCTVTSPLTTPPHSLPAIETPADGTR